MPLDPKLKKVMVIGSGPIIIGQAAEFDYAGTQACRALKEAGVEVVLVNSNPATIMTDQTMADHIYIEPLTLDVARRIIKIEKPDGLLSTLGGQTGLTLSMQLAREGFLEEHGVTLLGARLDTIEKAEDRQMFKDAMAAIGQPCIPSRVETTVEGSVAFAEEIGYPVVVRPAFTMGGTGGGFANNTKELREIAGNGLRLSPITQVLIEKGIAGWKEIEFEVMRDARGDCITICSMENLDPVGVHTGDSIVIAPAVSLSVEEFSMLRNAALMIVEELKVEGGCNCQFAMHPTSKEYAVIEVNPRVSRSSALASKATGYPIAKVATRIAIGFALDEIPNEVTGVTTACFEPTIDYIVVKFPKWPFDKFVYGKRTLGTQMKATGEVMSIGVSFENALMKAVRSAELGLMTPSMPLMRALSDAELMQRVASIDDERIFAVYEALSRGVTPEEIHEITMIDNWFLYKLLNLAGLENRLNSREPLTEEFYRELREFGFPDSVVRKQSGQEIPISLPFAYKMVDTCAGEYPAKTPYFYSTCDEESDAVRFIANQTDKKPAVFVFGSGPIRIGQGIEFDYCSVHCANTLKEQGYAAVMLNNNPETVSTDFNTGDRLYFDPLTPEDVAGVAAIEKPIGAIVQFGGQTAIKLTRHLESMGIPILGTPADSVDIAEDRERFDDLLERLNIPRAKGATVMTTEEALSAADKLGYPVMLRPSYVLGGQNMIIAHAPDDITEYMEIILRHGIENPVLIDQYLMGTEIEVDAICDGENFLIPGIMEHIERAGVHSGDSISVYPPQTLTDAAKKTIVRHTEAIAKALNVIGMVNIQYVVYHDEVYIIEVNPRSSRTVPYISKVTGIPMVSIATRIMFGAKLSDFSFGSGLYPERDMIAVKVPVFSFEKLQDVDTQLGPEMKSTGEVLGIAPTFEEALLKGLVGAGYSMKKSGGVLFSLRDTDKLEALPLVERFQDMGFDIYATGGTARTLNAHMIAANAVLKVGEGEPNLMTLLESGKIDYVISTASKGRKPARDGVQIRRKAVERSIVCLTSLDTTKAMLDCLRMRRGIDNIDLVDIVALS